MMGKYIENVGSKLFVLMDNPVLTELTQTGEEDVLTRQVTTFTNSTSSGCLRLLLNFRQARAPYIAVKRSFLDHL